MFKQAQISILFGLLCVGCDTAAKQQQAEDARRAATVAELKQLGQAMHESQNKESSPTGTANDAPKDSDESKDNQSVMPSAAESSNAAEGSVDSPSPK